MSWLSRSDRWTEKKNTMGRDLGPGSYQLNMDSKKTPGFAPFGSTNLRDNSSAFVTPGPGAYAKSNQRRNSAGLVKTTFGTSLGTSSKVFDTPGPGSYAGTSSFGKKYKKRPTRNKPVNAAYVRVPTVPSIPIVAQSFGYERGRNGAMVAQKPVYGGHAGHQQDSAGPGEYHTQTVSKNRASDFSKSKAMRSLDGQLKEKAALPGPGAYTVEGRMERPKESAVFKASKRNNAKSDANKKMPGPGAYDTAKSTIQSKSKPEHLQFFGSSSYRFQQQSSIDADMPGPGSYGFMQQSAMKKTNAAKKVAFTCNESRFKDKSNSASGNVDFYEMPSMAQELENKLVSRTGAFGTSDKRFKERPVPEEEPDVTNDATEYDYDVEKSPPKQTSNFASKSNRFAASNSSTCPSPGTYDVSVKWEAKAGKGILQGSSSRSTVSIATTPGPGSYNAPISTSKPKNYGTHTLSGETRFKQHAKVLQTPGPGAYDADAVQGSLHTPTYNITIAEQMYKSARH